MLEIGTGWGGFAVHAARDPRLPRDDDDDLARAARPRASRARRARPGSRTASTVLLDDYRDLRGTYDKLVSIEMIEAVGWKDFGTFFERCSRLLAPDGAMLLQAITIDDRAYEVEKASQDASSAPTSSPTAACRRIEVIAALRRAPHRPAHGRSRGHHAALRRDAAALARELRGARPASSTRSATTSASGACGGCT